MATTKKTTKKKDDVPVAGLAAGAALAATAAGATYYFYASKHARAHRRDAAKWANGLKREVVKDAKKVTKLGRPVMEEIIDRVARSYGAAQHVDPSDLKAAARELKDNWTRIRKELTGGRAPAKKKPAKKRQAKTRSR